VMMTEARTEETYGAQCFRATPFSVGQGHPNLNREACEDSEGNLAEDPRPQALQRPLTFFLWVYNHKEKTCC